jgi:AraC-like DNA-binding protein
MKFFDDLEFVCSGESIQAASAYRDHYFDGYWGLQFVRRGRIVLKTGSSAPAAASGPVCFFTAPGESFSYWTPEGETRDHLFVCFRGERVERYKAGGLIPPQTETKFYPVADEPGFLRLWRALLHVLRQGRKTSHAEAVLLLEQLLVRTAEFASAGRSRTSGREAFLELASRIANAPGDPWDFGKEARSMGMSAVHFRRIFREVAGMAPWQYVIQCRIRYASQLLLASGKLVKEIAGECGFASAFHFSREFKRIMKKSPEHFRKSI